MRKSIFLLSCLILSNSQFAMEYEDDEGEITQISLEEMTQLEKKAREISDDYKKLVAVLKKDKSKYYKKKYKEVLKEANKWEEIANLQQQEILILKDLERLLNDAERKIPTQS